MKEKNELFKQGEIGPDVVLRDIAEDCIENSNIKVCVGDDGKIFRRVSESIDWMECRSGLGKEDHLFGVATDNNFNFCAFGRGGVILKSPDRGVSWNVARKKVADDGNVMKGAHGNGIWLAILDKGKKAGCLLKSTDDGETWFEFRCSIPNATAIEFLNGRFIVGTKDEDIYSSENGNKFQKSTMLGTFEGARCVGYNPETGVYYAAGHQIARSIDGINWMTFFDLTKVDRYGNRNLYAIIPVGQYTYFFGEDSLILRVDKDNNIDQLGSIGKGTVLGAIFNDDRIITVGADGEKFILLKDLGADIDDSDDDSDTPPTIPPPEPNPTPGKKTNAQWFQEGIDYLKAAEKAFRQIKL